MSSATTQNHPSSDTISQGTQASFPAGQRLHCANCGSEIEIIKPCTCQPPDQVLRCCGKDMQPST